MATLNLLNPNEYEDDSEATYREANRNVDIENEHAILFNHDKSFEKMKLITCRNILHDKNNVELTDSIKARNPHVIVRSHAEFQDFQQNGR